MNYKNNEILSIVSEDAAHFESEEEKHQENQARFNESNFQPGYHFMHLVKSNPFYCLMRVLDSTALQDLQAQWNEWVHCTICAEYSAFSDDMDRNFLLRFAMHFHLLMDASHYAVHEWMKMKKKRLFIADRQVIYRYLPETGKAYQQILGFTATYSERKARVYLWSVLDCILGCGTYFKIDHKNVLFDYESLLCMLRAPYHMIKRYPALFGIEEKKQEGPSE
ncbi:hypothetical protein LQ567_12660 [Niabella pedocola]|uniref:Transposase IS200-like domain-containing protein n=1 Tax=Niabella pedocola TaxID=1752077 RepID=A0ABS8PS37_9BACT|nr:hypothetical protein [Niabella pedocola]MCD2423619.1 hypothetical protein [Niabella pedocola]